LSILLLQADARHIPLASNSIDMIITSPPYWRKRDYGIATQIGREKTAEQYIASIIEALREWRRLLRPTGSIFLNVGDSYKNLSLVGIPGMVESAARSDKWLIRNRIIWTKENGAPDSAKNRLAVRHEYIFHLTQHNDYFYDIVGYTEKLGASGNPGDVWRVKSTRNNSRHLAPFPREIVERAILLACPQKVCPNCQMPSTRLIQRSTKLNPKRPQARRAMEIAEKKQLTAAHISAIQATGISDAGKAVHFQNGAGRNAAKVQKLAEEAKQMLGGYFREFTFALPETLGWSDCGCGVAKVPGVVFDPFVGTGTTLWVANEFGRTAIGSDLDVSSASEQYQEIQKGISFGSS
jgi:DNA modification methylase